MRIGLRRRLLLAALAFAPFHTTGAQSASAPASQPGTSNSSQRAHGKLPSPLLPTALQRARAAGEALQTLLTLCSAQDSALSAQLAANATLQPVLAFLKTPLERTTRVPSYAELQHLTLALQRTLATTSCPPDSSRAPRGRLAVAYWPAPPLIGGAAVPSAATGLAAEESGVAAWFFGRARDELVIAYLDRTKTWLLTDPTGKTISSLMPLTREAVNHVENDEPVSVVPTLRSAAVHDISGLPARISDVSVWPPSWIKKLNDENGGGTKRWLQGVHQSILVAQAIREGATPSDALGTLTSITADELSDNPLRAGLITLGSLAREFRADSAGFVQSATDAGTLTLFVAFLARDLAVINPSPFDSDAAGDLRELFASDATGIADAMRAVVAFHSEIGSLRQQAGSSPMTADVYAGAVSAAARALRSVLRLAPLGAADSTSLRETDLLALIETGADLERAVAARDYPQVIVGASQMFNVAHDPHGTAALEGVLDISSYRFLVFAANLAAATSPDQVTAALEASAVPVSTFRTKRMRAAGAEHAPWVMWLLNGYLGANYGGEWLSPASAKAARYGHTLGASLPVGVEAAIPTDCWLSSLSLFVPLIDLGTVASYRLHGSQTGADPVLGLQQLLAPGAMVMLGLSRSAPVSMGGGWQYTPQLRRDPTTGQRLSAQRFVAILGIDVPVFRF